MSDKTIKFLLNYSCLFWGPFFIWTQCSLCMLYSQDAVKKN